MHGRRGDEKNDRRVQQMGPKSGNTFLKKVTIEVAPRVSQRLKHQENGESLALRGSVSQDSNIWNAQSQRKSAGTGHPEAVMGDVVPEMQREAVIATPRRGWGNGKAIEAKRTA